MRIFINNVDGFVGKALCSDLRGALAQENRLLGTVTGDDTDGKTEMVQQMGVKRVVSRVDQEQYLKDVLSCSLIVFDLHSADIQDVESVIKHLKVAPLDHETTFVLISSVNVWARTRKQYVPLDGEDGEAGGDEDDGEAKEGKTRPQELTDADLDRRIPSPAFESWKYLETLVLSLSSKEKLRPHVIAAGILYGNGETVFNEYFQAAWLTQPTQVVMHPGTNYIPCVHVRDVARLVKVVHVRDPSTEMGKYLIAVDKARLTQAEIVQGIVNQISRKAEIPLISSDDARSEFKDVMMLDLIMEPSAPMKASSFPWWCRDGLVANLVKVAAEFCKWRNLRPIKMVMMGPPGSGAERLCSMVADRYLHADPPHFTFDQIVQDAMAAGTVAARKLTRKVNKLSKKPGAKLPLKMRTKLVHKRLMSNVCRFRGYILEGYPTTYEEAKALFTEKVLEEGEEEEAPEEEEDEVADAGAEEGEEGEEEEEAPAPAEEEDEDEEVDGKPTFQLNKAVVPEFVVALHSKAEVCKTRIFSRLATGPSNEEEFALKTAEYYKANFTQDGTPGTADFFSEVVGAQVLQIDADASNETDAFQSLRVYLESRGQFFNYLKSEEDRCRDLCLEVEHREREEDEHAQAAKAAQEAKESELRKATADYEADRRKNIADSEATHLENEVLPLRQYLMVNVVPTLSEGLAEICKEQPEDPIEYLAQYLFAHAQDIAGSLTEL